MIEIRYTTLHTSLGKEQKIVDKLSKLSMIKSIKLVDKPNQNLGKNIIIHLDKNVSATEIFSIGAYAGQTEEQL